MAAMLRWIGFVLLLGSAIGAYAQGGRSYGPGSEWWNAGQGGILPWEEDYDNPDGMVGIVNKSGALHTEHHPFFEALGANGRACVTCHQPSNAMSVSAASLKKRWTETGGKDPVFAAIDGSNCPNLPQGEMSSHSLLIERGLFRISLPWPPKETKPEFRIEVLSDPTGCNSGSVYGLKSANPAISVYRRPRIAANLNSVMHFMADGREPDLRSQAITAIMVHEQAKAPPSVETVRQIVEFETQIYAAQSADIRGGLLNEKDGPGLGPQNLAAGRAAKLSFDVWKKPEGGPDLGLQREFRASVARGSEVFQANCAVCHRATSTHWIDIGTTNRQVANDLPLFRITCDPDGRTIFTQDPGRALISGKCADVGIIVPQQLRGLAARAPYFSSGLAQTLRDVLERSHEGRLEILYTEQQEHDLLNFLRVL